MMPDDIEYRASWLDEAGTRCFQIVEAPQQESAATWINRWDDLVEFEVVPVVTFGRVLVEAALSCPVELASSRRFSRRDHSSVATLQPFSRCT